MSLKSTGPEATLLPSNKTSASNSLTYPYLYNFPPFFELQPVQQTRSAQLAAWSAFIQSYCRHHRLFALTPIDALPTPLFTNAAISHALRLKDARAVLSWMASKEGGHRAEWINSSNSKKSGGREEDGGAARCWIFWRTPEEWAGLLEEWVERTGQKGSVVTLYEITESDATKREEFWGMDAELLMRCLQVCVKRGKAQVFGSEGSEGVKFF